MEYHNHKFNPLKWKNIKGVPYPTIYFASGTLRASSDSAVTKTSSGTYNSVKEIKVFGRGTIRVTYSYSTSFGCSVSFGGASGGVTGTSSYTNFEDPPQTVTGSLDFDASVYPGDIVYLSISVFDTGFPASVSNFRLYWDNKLYKSDKSFFEIL